MGFFTIVVNIDGLERKFDTLAELADDLEPPLRMFGAYLLRRTRARYKAQEFAPLAESTIQKRANKGMHSLERKLQGDVRKAMRRARKSRNEPRGVLAKIFETANDRAMQDVLSSSSRGAQNRLAVLAAFQQHHGSTWGKKGGVLADKVQAKSLSLKQNISLLQREGRAVMRQIGKPILGGLDRTLMIDVDEDTVTLKSQTHQEWSAAHNEGATVGRGAKLPERKTIFLEASDLDVFESILKDHHMVAFDEDLQGPGY